MKSLIKLAAAIYLSAGCSSAFAQAETEYMRASQEMEQHIAQSIGNGRMPRLVEKTTADLITTLSDSQRFLDSKEYQVNDLGLLMGICDRANRVVMSYALFGLKDHINPKADPTQIRLQTTKLMENNLTTFQDELERLQPFLIRCMAKEVPLLTKFTEALKPSEFTDARRAGLQQGRNGLLSIYLGSLQSINNTALRAPYRTQMIRVLAETSQSFASALQIPARNQIANMAKTMTHSATPNLRKDLEEIAETMNNPSCAGLCRL